MELPIWEMKLMPRRPLLKRPGVPLHIIQRGNKRAACFFATKDYGCYLHHLQHLCQAEGVVLHAYVLMTNHVHLLLAPQQIKNVACPRLARTASAIVQALAMTMESGVDTEKALSLVNWVELLRARESTTFSLPLCETAA